ncbi:hypothetical protein SDRG_17205 [Saprolegnia diclina VS20]|uniref:Uncharacterized protein n=1 Tax=Saprolegnia diclina (strain VS20) TaxID=1156394 RepID=T0QYT6_SAPDV|nr:hypothetical protein SDRG_17205 [Saprolegnia diclina VS20]EQC24908.1 hypothetical protein SDRG_17205 [Saprolegnia diclina VS20]|eukprot:XP_008621666.1 hypothetical protein SDRG_17205 [Saprolegnia diclina VS20]
MLELPPFLGTIRTLRELATPRFDWTGTTKHLGGGNSLDELYLYLSIAATMLRARRPLEAKIDFHWDEATAPAPNSCALHGMLINDIFVPLVSVLLRHPSTTDVRFHTTDDDASSKDITATLQPYMALVSGFVKSTVATTELVFATQCLLVSILAVQGPPSDAITCASVAASSLKALKAAYRHVLVALQRPDTQPHRVGCKARPTRCDPSPHVV